MKKSLELAIQQLKEKWPNIEMIESYVSGNTKMKFRCNECGHEWITTWQAVMHAATKCPNCGVKEKFRNRSIEYVKSKLSNDFEFISYDDPQHVTVKCKTCGKTRTTFTSNLLKYGCKSCKSKKTAQCLPKSLTTFIQEAKSIHGDKYDYSNVVYTNCHEKVCIICPEHGEFWQSPIKHISARHGCPKCAGYGKTLNDFLTAARTEFGDFYNYDKVVYKNSITPVTVTCPLHGDFQVTPQNHIKMHCKCHLCVESAGEKSINSILNSLKIPFTREVTILNPYNTEHNFRVDFYITYNNQDYIIEYNGRQHYEPVRLWGGELAFQILQTRDENLRLYCKEKNIHLLEIKYNAKNIQLLVEEFLDVPSTEVTLLIITEQKR